MARFDNCMGCFVCCSSGGQFHQPSGTKCKFVSSHSSVLAAIFLRHLVSPTKLRPTLPLPYKQLENTLNFYAKCPMLYASKIYINLLVQKLQKLFISVEVILHPKVPHKLIDKNCFPSFSTEHRGLKRGSRHLSHDSFVNFCFQ